MRRVVLALSLSIAACAAGIAPGHADHGPVLVVPSRAGQPVMINGRDASYAVIEGDWGLNRPGAGPFTVIYPPPRILAPSDYGYYPHTGKRPRAGRLEIEPPANRVLPRPAQSFHRVWSVGPEAEPVAEPLPYDPPPVIMAPDYERRELLRRRN
jgi:hypothetical protein